MRLFLLPLAIAASALAFAAGPNLAGQVDTLASNQVQLTATEPVPAWVAQGITVQAFGWDAVVHEVRGQQVTLRLDTSRLTRVKPGDAVSIRAPTADEPQMCGS